MGHWNHRVVKKVFEDGYVQYSIREVFYTDTGEIYGYTEEPIDLACDSIDDLREYIGWCLKALDAPVLEDGKVEFAKDDTSDDDLENSEEWVDLGEFLDKSEKDGGEDKQGG